MIKRCLISSLLMTAMVAAPACGEASDDGDGSTSDTSDASSSTDTNTASNTDSGDGDASSGDGDSGDGDASSGDGDSGDGDSGDGDSGDGDSGDGDSGDGDSGDGDTGDGDTGVGDCQMWRITYDLDGSEFQITDTPLNAGNKNLPLEEPYDSDDTIGPGDLTLMIADNAGAPGDGTIALVDYYVKMDFAVEATGTTVTQDLTVTTAANCGQAAGTTTATAGVWSPNILEEYHSEGTINCSGNFCGMFGAPPPGDSPVDETGDIDPFSEFTFSEDFSTFSAPAFTTSSDDSATTVMILAGTEVSRELVDAPGCLCD